MDPQCYSLPAGQLVLWCVEESNAVLEAYCTPREREEVQAFASEQRRREWLGWRALVHRLRTQVEISYNAQGAPQLSDGSCISVSHAAGWVAVVLSERPCGVDVEQLDRRFERVTSRYISAEEVQLAVAVGPHFNALIWSAKEALYKWAGIEGANLLTDIQIHAIDAKQQIMRGSVRGCQVTLYYRFQANLCVISCAG